MKGRSSASLSRVRSRAVRRWLGARAREPPRRSRRLRAAPRCSRRPAERQARYPAAPPAAPPAPPAAPAPSPPRARASPGAAMMPPAPRLRFRPALRPGPHHCATRGGRRDSVVCEGAPAQRAPAAADDTEAIRGTDCRGRAGRRREPSGGGAAREETEATPLGDGSGTRLHAADGGGPWRRCGLR